MLCFVNIVTDLMVLVEALVKARPTGSKGTYLQKVSLSSTMGPGVKIDIASIS